MSNQLLTPVLFLIFNRPETTRRVFDSIKRVRPKYLYIAADGPRPQKEGESGICISLRKLVLSEIDWPCEVQTLFREQNLGCKIAVSSAIDWFFKNEEQGIILEDDCLPDETFFTFCSELLEKYCFDDTVFMIGGTNFLPQSLITKDSYYFSYLPHIWGWATWRRAWNKFDVSMNDFAEFKNNKIINNIWTSKKVQRYWLNIFNDTSDGKIDTWDYQWNYAMWKNYAKSITPNVNLISNLGFGSGSHTVVKYKNIRTISATIEFPLRHPSNNVYDQGDYFENKNIFLKWFYLKRFLKKIGVLSLIKEFIVYIKK